MPAVEPYGAGVAVMDPGGQVFDPVNRGPFGRCLEQRRTDPLVSLPSRHHRVDLRRGLRPQNLMVGRIRIAHHFDHADEPAGDLRDQNGMRCGFLAQQGRRAADGAMRRDRVPDCRRHVNLVLTHIS